MLLFLIAIGILGGSAAAAGMLWLGFGWLAALTAYSLGGAAAMLLSLTARRRGPACSAPKTAPENARRRRVSRPAPVA